MGDVDVLDFHRTRADKAGNLIPYEIIDDRIAKYIIATNDLFILGGCDYLYLGGVYRFDKHGILLKKLIASCIVEELRNVQRIDRVYKLILIDYDIQKEYDDINKYPAWWVNFQNGMLDLKTMELKPHKPEYLSINQLPHDWNDSAVPSDSICEEFISSLIKNEDDRKMFLEYCGYCLTRDTHFQKMMYVRGVGGIGKSELLRLVELSAGVGNVSHLTIQNLNDRFSPVFLLGKLANIYADVSSEEMQDTSGLKTITGEDFVRGEYKGGDVFSFKPYAKLLFSANRIPHTNDDRTNAIYRRLMILQLNERAKHFDNLTERLADDIDSFIKLIVSAAHEAYMRGELTESESSKQVIIELQNESDSVASFLYECIENADGERIDRTDLYDKYTEYCEDNGRVSKSQTGFYSSLSDKGYSQRRGHKERYFVNIKYKEDMPEVPDEFR